MDLTERQWRLIAPLLPKPKFHRDGRGRTWRDPLPRYPPYQTYHRRFQLGVRAGTRPKILETLARDLAERGGVDLTEGFINATFAGAKNGLLRRQYS